jgi:hypothetical protein
MKMKKVIFIIKNLDINKDIPSNSKKTGETTKIAKKKLNIIYRGGYLNHLKNLKKKIDKILEGFNKFEKKVNPLFGIKGLDLENCENNKCFSDGCNITNLPDVYNILVEKGKKIENLISNLRNRINSRLYKTKEIKEKWINNYNELTYQDPVIIDYTIYPNDEIANKRIFEEIFEEQKIGAVKILNPTVRN